MEDPRIPADPRLIKLLSFIDAPVLPHEMRIDPSIIEAMEAFFRGGKTRNIRVEIIRVPTPAWDFSLLQVLAHVIKLRGFGVTAAGELIEFPMDLQQQAGVLKNIGTMPFLTEAELDLAQLEGFLNVLTGNGVLQMDALPRIMPDLDLSVPALFHSQPADVPDRQGSSALLGVVDFGCDFVHPNFRDDDEGGLEETRLETLVVIDSHGNSISHPRATINQVLDEREPYKRMLYDPHDGRNQPHAAYDPRRFGAHGTLVLDAAAGNGQSTRLKGVAPQARLAFVQLESDRDGNPPQTSVRDAIQEIFKLAQSTNVPVVVNLSMNPNSGPRNGFGSLAVALSTIPEWDHGRHPGRAIVVAAGNVRGAGLRSAGRSLHRGGSTQDSHALRVVLPDEQAPTDQIIRIYHPLGTTFRITFAVPSSIGQTRSISLDPEGPQHSWPRDGKYIQTCRRTGVGVMETTIHLKTAALERNRQWTFFVTLPTTGSVKFYVWIDRVARTPPSQLVFDATDAREERTIGDFGATRGVISVGAYYALMEETPACFYSAEGPTEQVDNQLAWDPLADRGNKPDIVAPGHGVHVALSHSGDLPDDRVHSDVHRRAIVASGTSLAAAHVSGLIALLLHRVPDATAEDLRRVLIETAKPVKGQSPRVWMPRVGYGQVHAGEALTHPFPKILQPMNMATEPSRDVPVVVHLRNLAHPEDVHSVIAQAYHLQGSEPVTTVELDYQSGSREWKETLRLREPGEFALEVVVKMKHPKGSTPEGTVFRAYPVLLTVP